MEACYYCETAGDEGSYYCNDCRRWQCNTETCGCVCSITDGDLYSSFTGDMTASEVLEIGLDDLNVHIAELWRDAGFMDGFQYKYLPHLASDQERIKALAETIYEYARSYDPGDIDFPLVVDTPIQIDLTGEIDCPLLNYDLILRANDEGTQYIGFDIYDIKNQTHKAWIGFGEESQGLNKEL